MQIQRKYKFGEAVELMKNGAKIQRLSWNGKDMYIYYVPSTSYPASRNSNGAMLGKFPDDMVPYHAYIAMKTDQNVITPWAPAQSDVLDEDWVIVV